MPVRGRLRRARFLPERRFIRAVVRACGCWCAQARPRCSPCPLRRSGPVRAGRLSRLRRLSSVSAAGVPVSCPGSLLVSPEVAPRVGLGLPGGRCAVEADIAGIPVRHDWDGGLRVCRALLGHQRCLLDRLGLRVLDPTWECRRSSECLHRYRSPARHPAGHDRPEGAFEPVWVSSVALLVDDFPATPRCGPIRV